jgi:glycosyltransferase involved in cell wall biosynthesis
MANNIRKNKQTIYFFFPYYHTGGAEKVYLQIVKCFGDKRCIVFFTDRSRDNKNKKEFKDYALCFNLFGISNKIKIFKKILIFILSFIINKSDDAIVFGSNSRFFYSLLHKINKHIKVVDLVHWLDGEMGEIIIKNTEKVSRRIVVTEAIKPVLEKEYAKNKINQSETGKVKVIENCVLNNLQFKKDYQGKLKVLYIGRNTYEKRPELALAVQTALEGNHNLEFLFIGRGLKKVVKDKNNKVKVIELIEQESEMNKVYHNAHIIILTSMFEGFPCVIMEAMSFGVVPISTAVGGIPIHLQDGINSMLVDSNSEKEIIDSISKNILKLEKDRSLLKDLSMNAYKYALNNFSCEKFCAGYKAVIKN